MNDKVKENRFLDALEALFTGAEVEGESGFINLMRMKRGYFKSLRSKLMERVDSRAEEHTAFRYVVTLDKLPSELLAKIAGYKGASAQVEEWRELGLVDEKFSVKMLSEDASYLYSSDPSCHQSTLSSSCQRLVSFTGENAGFT